MDSSKEIINWIKNGSFEKVCLQFSEDLKKNSAQMAVDLQKSTNSQIFIIDEASCGTCCTNKHISSYVGANACVHFGHACLTKNDLSTYNVFPHQKLDLESLIKNFQNHFENNPKNIVLFYDVGLENVFDKLNLELKKYCENLIISKLNDKNTTSNTILGRSYELPTGHCPEMYEGIFLGQNEKTLMILSMSIPLKQWHYFDENKFCAYSITNSFWFKKRSYLIEKIRDSHTFGLVIATLNISEYMNIVKYLKFILKKLKKKTYLFCIEKIEPTKLANFQEVDIFVAIACPENSIFNSKDFLKPIVTPFDIELAFNELRNCSTLHAIDFKQILPGGSNHIDFEQISKSDVSLVTGKVRNENMEEAKIDSSSLVQKSYGELQDNQTSSAFLQSRLWKGLEMNLGEDDVATMEEGRSGIPINYVNEL